MNSIILLLKSADKNQNLFKTDISTDSQSCREYLTAAAEAIITVEEEVADLIYDERAFKCIIENISDNSYPNVTLLQEYFNDFTDFRIAENYSVTEITIAGIKYKDNILGAVLYGKDCVNCILDHDAIRPYVRYYIENCDNLSESNFTILRCSGVELHNWFVNNRSPQRNYDFDYDKHHPKERKVAGDIISSQPYSRDQIATFLRKAVGLKGDKRRYYKINDDSIAVFCDENLKLPTFHGYVVLTSDQKEMSKILAGNLNKKLANLCDSSNLDL